VPRNVPRELLLNAFDMNTVGHLAHGLWRHPRDQARRYTDIHYWQSLAQTLERGLFDGLFLADAVGLYDVYGGGPGAALEAGVQVPANDPAVLVPAMAAVTRHLGFGITANLSHEPPYLFARRMSTLDHLSQGRLGWNIVTGFLDSTARAHGQASQTRHDERYDRADDYMALVYQLWEGSWADDAVLADPASGQYARPERVRTVRHQGPYYQLEAIHLSEPSPQRTPLLFQAGASARGLRFAARHAEALFLPNQGLQGTAQLVQQLNGSLQAQGRTRDSYRLLTSLEVVVGRDADEARDKYADYARHARPQAALVQLASATGIDFARYAPDEPIRPDGLGEGIQSIVRSLAQSAGHGPDGAVTVRELLTQMPLGGRISPIVGSPDEVVAALLHWADHTGVDGFNLVRTVTPECFVDFIDLVVPRLQALGRYKTAYAPGTLREKLTGHGPHLPAAHPGALARQGAASPPA